MDLKAFFENIKEKIVSLYQLIKDYCSENKVKPEKPYKGNFNIRVGSDLHTLAIERADKEGISLNKLVCDALKAYLL